MEQKQQKPFVVFFVVAPEDAPFLTQWEGYLLPLQENGYLTIWSEQHLADEASCQKESLEHLFQADLILLLMSPSCFATDECLTQMEPQTLHRKIKPVEAFSWSWRQTISNLLDNGTQAAATPLDGPVIQVPTPDCPRSIAA